MALGVGQSSQTWAEGAMGTRRLYIQKGAQPGLPHCFSLRSRISVKPSDDQIAHIFGKTRSNIYSIKCHTTIVCRRWKDLSGHSIQFLYFNDWEVRAEKTIVAQGHRAVSHQAIMPDCKFHPTDKWPLWARPPRDACMRKQAGMRKRAHLVFEDREVNRSTSDTSITLPKVALWPLHTGFLEWWLGSIAKS